MSLKTNKELLRGWDRTFGVNGGKGVDLPNPKVQRSFWNDTSELAGDQEGFSSLGNAESLAMQKYTSRTAEPVNTLLLKHKIAFGEKVREDLLKKLQGNDFSLLTRDFSSPFREDPGAVLLDSSVWVGPKGVFSLKGASGEERDEAEEIVFASTDLSLLKNFADWWAGQTFDNLKGRISTAKISGIFQGKSGPQIRTFRDPIGWPIEQENYDPSVLAFYEKARNELASRNPSGRLVILDGPPGTGKTFLLRGLVHDLASKAEFLYLPASMVGSLDGPAMITMLDYDEPVSEDDPVLPKIFIIEDADECLISRASDNMSPIRNLLNYCDGFLGTLLDIRVIATTNSGHIGRTDKIDKALLRPGRLLAHATVGALAQEQAEKRLRHLTGNDKLQLPSAPLPLANIYSLARENGWTPKE
jgi:hypothetical protein